eukprot:Nk52_evm12s967 gene=Nk52_evmTU12s967
MFLHLVTWNINGIRAVSKRYKTPKEFLDSLTQNTDQIGENKGEPICHVLCFQETKVTRDQMDSSLASISGYDAYYTFCKTRPGYSGCVTFVEEKGEVPFGTSEAVEGFTGRCKQWTSADVNEDVSHGIEGTGAGKERECLDVVSPTLMENFTEQQLQSFDIEGRTVMSDHGWFVLLNVYAPMAHRGGGDEEASSEERWQYKLDFMAALFLKCRELVNRGREVILVGDLNFSHRKIDNCDPEEYEAALGGEGSFDAHPVRRLFSELVESHGFIDCFRYVYPDKGSTFTCWRVDTGARQTNYGNRIDYIVASPGLKDSIADCVVRSDIEGSDHCPVVLRLDISKLKKRDCFIAESPASLCASFMPEFRGKQSSIKSFFKAGAWKHKSPQPVNKFPLRKRKASSSQTSLLGFVKLKSKATADPLPKPSLPQPPENSSSGSSQSAPRVNEQKSLYEIEKEAMEKAKEKRDQESAGAWSKLFKPPEIPKCKGHQETCNKRTVKKQGKNFGRKFYVCPRPAGHKDNPEADCGFFKWA